MWMTSSDNYKLHTSLMIIDFLLAEIVTENASMSGFAKKHPHAQRDSPRCNVRKRPLGVEGAGPLHLQYHLSVQKCVRIFDFSIWSFCIGPI